jgi:hypothetical protein
MIPMSGSSLSIRNPESCQNSLIAGQRLRVRFHHQPTLAAAAFVAFFRAAGPRPRSDRPGGAVSLGILRVGRRAGCGFGDGVTIAGGRRAQIRRHRERVYLARRLVVDLLAFDELAGTTGECNDRRYGSGNELR